MSKMLTILLSFVTFCSFSQIDAFVYIGAGEYEISNAEHYGKTMKKVQTSGFYISTYEVTNKDFQEFVEATGYKTLAEKYQSAQVFEPGLEKFRWLQDSTAYWRYPNGISRGDILDKMDHPVTCISYYDAVAYCEWASLRLPTIEEWEIAAKAGGRSMYSTGIDVNNISEYANIWHGKDYLTAHRGDKYMYTSPVGSLKANAWGLYDVFGNVFEFCSGSLERDNQRKVVHARGGSWWCSKTACDAFNSTFVGSVHPSASFSNLGFRVVKDQ